MAFELTEEQRDIMDMVREYAQKELKARADECDKTGVFPKESLAEMAEMGLMGLNIPEEYGGSGMDDVTKVLVVREVAKACASTAEALAVHLLVNYIIKANGNEEQKKKYLTMAAEGKLGAFALTEPGAGSDAQGIRTSAVKDGDDYIINGSKVFISNMGPDEGDYAVVITSIKDDQGEKTTAAFLVDRGTPGMEIGKVEDKMGIRAASVSELIFTDCRVPATQMLGTVGQGFKIAMSGLNSGRIGIAAQACGVAHAALEEAVRYTKERVQFGKPISANQGVQWYLADMATQVEAADLLTIHAASMMDRGEDCRANCSMAKYYAAETANLVAQKALQLHGGYGYMKDYAIERIFRDARILTIYEGTSEVQKMVISRELLK